MTLAPPRRDAAGGPPAPARRTGRPWWPTWPAVLLAAVAYVPLLLTAPGRVGADTKQYLYLDPGRLLARAPAMWDPGVGMGTVTHQSIGYLLPMGPFYWVLEHVGLPVWVAQRLWTGSLLFAAGTGVLFLLRSFGWRDRVTVVAALGYALSPYVLEYEARMSAILLPWAGLPWLVGIAVRGLRSAPSGRAGFGPAGWRWPAAFALVVTLVGSVNATSLIYAGLGPVLWLPFAVWGTREVTARTALAVCLRTGVLTVVASLWWIAGLATQAGYGLDVLAYTETVKTVASGSQASEVLRGLGNWYFYGRDGIGSWIRPARDYTGSLWLIAVSFAVPLLALVAAALVRWAHRAYFVTLVLVGTAVSVGVYPYGHPSPLGALFKAFARSSTAGLALRSMPRAVPLVALGLSVLLAAGLAALWEAAPRAAAGARRRLPAGAAVVVVALVAADMAPLWRGQFVDPGLDRPEKLPAYQTQVAAALDARGPATRVLELPGADFSHYRWGATLDPVPPGIMDRPFVSRELIPSGQPASADLLRALDRRLQEGVLETAALPALARLMGVGDVELRSDLEYERFRTPRPRSTWALFTRSRPDGLAAPRAFGPPVPETPVIPLTDEITLGTPPTAPDPPAVAVFGVRDPVPIVRGERAERPLLVSGNGEGLVDAAAAGLLDGSGVVLYTASLDHARLRRALDTGADLLLTDSNRRRAERWGTIRENYGYVERAGETPLREDPSDARLPVFPGAGDDSRTVAEQRGVASVVATGYGNPVAYAPADRPSNAFDGDPDTAWRVGAFSDPRGERLRVDLGAPVDTDRLRLVQPLTGPRNRWLTAVALRFDGGPPLPVALGAASRTAAGQQVVFPRRRFSRLEIEVRATSTGVRAAYTGQSGVGFAEVRIGGRRLEEVLRLPTDLLAATGPDSLRHRLLVQLTRDRADPAEPFKSDTEPAMSRELTLPTARDFTLTGTARVSAAAPDPVVDRTVGRPVGGVRADSSGRLPGSLAARAAGAFDGDPATLWSPGLGPQEGAWLSVTAPRPVTLSALDLSVVADGRHSVPTTLRLEVDGRPVRTFDLPPLPDVAVDDGTRPVRLAFPPVRGSRLRLVVEAVREVRTRDSISERPIALPVAFAEVGAAGLRVPPTPPRIPSPCRADLLTVDGQPVGVRVTGSGTAAASREGLRLSGCGGPLRLGPGPHVVRTTPGRVSGLDVDRLLLASAAGGSATPAAGPVASAAPAGRVLDAPRVSVRSQGRTSYALRVTGARPGRPFWLVLGQSLSRGWTGRAGGRPLGAPTLVDGYANGWLVTPTAASFDVTLTWTPQRRVRVALGLSAVGLLACLVLANGTRRRRRVPSAVAADPPPGIDPPLAVVGGRPPPRVVAASALSVTAVAAFLVHPAAGALVGLLALAALLLPRGRLLLRVGSAGCLAVSAAYVLYLQARYRLPSDGDWVAAFHKVATVSWLAVALLAADVVVAWARRRSPPPAASHPAASHRPGDGRPGR